MPRQATPRPLARQLGARLRVLRERAGLTQEALAWDCDVGKGFLSEVESGKRFPSMPTLHKLVVRLGVTMLDVFALDTNDARTRLLDAISQKDPDAVRKALRDLGFE
jgi:transcriptional regulator with XRE-family HTH domain